MSPTSIFAPASTPAASIIGLSVFVLAVTAAIFAVVAALIAYTIVRFRQRTETGAEPPQVYGSTQVELAWTVVPVLIVVVLFLATARVINAVQTTNPSPEAIHVVAVGHQFWWEYRYPGLGVATANELHIPVSTPAAPAPTVITLLSADTNHSFWVPRLGGKTDLIPNRVNTTWFDPTQPGLYLGQCAQYCGVQHAKMLLRVYVHPRDEFDRWVAAQRQPALVSNTEASNGRRIFEATACVNCHTVAGTAATGGYGPDLTHLMSRDTLAAGLLENTANNLRRWIENPGAIKPGVRMPAMGLSDRDLDAITAYLATLR